MKSVGYESFSGGHSFNQIPIPDDIPPPPFKPLSSSAYNIPFDHSQYGPPPSHYSEYSGQASQKKPIAVHPKAYDIYHTMKVKLSKEKNFVTLPTVVDNSNGLEIVKSIRYELRA